MRAVFRSNRCRSNAYHEKLFMRALQTKSWCCLYATFAFDPIGGLPARPQLAYMAAKIGSQRVIIYVTLWRK